MYYRTLVNAHVGDEKYFLGVHNGTIILSSSFSSTQTNHSHLTLAAWLSG